MIRPGRLLYLLKRDFRRGWKASRHFYKTLPRIEQWTCGFSEFSTAGTVPVHVLTGAEDWRLAAWMLASFFDATERRWPVVIHDDGTLPSEARGTLARLFPGTRFILRQEADASMQAFLRAYPFCEGYRASHTLALKIFDIPHFAKADRFLVLDSDVLFFRYPHAINDWVTSRADECWFNEDVSEGALISASEAKEELDVKLWEKVNSGVSLITKNAIDYDLCDRALAQTSLLRGHIWRVEQTLFALCASKHGKGGLLPKEYEVTLGRNGSEDAVSRHYVGAVRDRFYGEGLNRVARTLLAAAH
jgi:hypothetical protein